MALDEEDIQKIMDTVESLRDDINILAQFTKKNIDKLADSIKSVDDDLGSLDKDVNINFAQAKNESSEETYIKNMVNDDFMEMKLSLLDEVEKMVRKK